jgi:hypothetical protein
MPSFLVGSKYLTAFRALLRACGGERLADAAMTYAAAADPEPHRGRHVPGRRWPRTRGFPPGHPEDARLLIAGRSAGSKAPIVRLLSPQGRLTGMTGERLMLAEFPDDYPRYRQRVPQLVPGLRLAGRRRLASR